MFPGPKFGQKEREASIKTTLSGSGRAMLNYVFTNISPDLSLQSMVLQGCPILRDRNGCSFGWSVRCKSSALHGGTEEERCRTAGG